MAELSDPLVSSFTEKASPCSACSVRDLSVCAPLEDSELAEVSAIITSLVLSAGDPVFDEGEPAKHVFNVTSGAIKIYKLLPDGRRQVTGFLLAGDFLGLANDEFYAYSAEAINKSTLCRFPRGKLEVLLERFPRMERRLLSMASHELAVAQEQMLLLGRKTAREKIASFLLTLAKRTVQQAQSGNTVFLPMSRTDIGDYLGLTTETVSRTFTQLKQNGIITLHPGGKVDLTDRQQLNAIAEGA